MKKLIAAVLALGMLATVCVFSANASTDKSVKHLTGFVPEDSSSKSVR